jgi:hypothetical protein
MKLDGVLKETEELFIKVLNETSIPKSIRFELISSDDMKEVGKVAKANEILKYMTDIDIIVILNENIFDKLADDQKRMIIEELLAQVYWDSNTGKIKLIKPDVNTFSLLIKKYGIDFYLGVKDSIAASLNELDATQG